MLKSDAGGSEEYRRFLALTKRIIAVPKSELDAKLAEYEKAKQARKRARKRTARNGTKGRSPA